MSSIEISIRELHARTGHYVRLAAGDTEVIVTSHGKPAACITPLPAAAESGVPLGKRRKWLTAYRKALLSGKLKSARDSTQDVHEISALRDL
ncbi:MAG: type II toxin-antitoxin system prevent-host-death family antitoxin [Verrucomicrobia bacterium]|nr:type II toxin-antitoxin system prevent-host-death family antitoxin [Verrucomicrobiota bacterium]